MSDAAEKNVSSTPTESSRDWESFRNWLDVIAKLIGAVAIAGVTFIGYNYQSKASLSSVINQREQAESQLRAGMLSDLVEPIIGPKGAAGEEPNLERQLLLAEMVTLNFHDHFEFKPLLLEVDGKLRDAGGERAAAGREKLASDARRVIDRQINMLSSIDGISKQGSAYKAKVTGIDLVIPEDLTEADKAKSKGCAKEDIRLKKPTLAEPSLICVSSPDNRVCLLISLYSPDYSARSISMRSTIVIPDRKRGFWPWTEQTVDCHPSMDKIAASQANVKSLDEAYISIFDFPLTDNSKIVWQGDEYRFAVSLYEIQDANRPIRLRLVWFPQGFVTVRERPTSPVQYAKFLR